MEKKIYGLMLDNYAAPPYISVYKPYFGTIEDFVGFFNRLRNDEYRADGYKDLISTFDRFMQGEKSLKNTVAYSEFSFFEQADIFDEADNELENCEWEHINTWGFLYYMNCSKVKISHIWISLQDTFYRCIRAEFFDLKYGMDYGDYDEPTMFWGLPHQFEVDGNRMYTRLYAVEKFFDNKDDVLSDMQNFKKDDKPDFSSLIEDIFGDG